MKADFNNTAVIPKYSTTQNHHKQGSHDLVPTKHYKQRKSLDSNSLQNNSMLNFNPIAKSVKILTTNSNMAQSDDHNKNPVTHRESLRAQQNPGGGEGKDNG